MINLVIASKKVKVEGQPIRVDLAWDLFLPSSDGDLPEGKVQDIDMLKNWLWRQLGRKLGYLKNDKSIPVTVLLPKLTKAGLDFVVRTCSFWSDEIYLLPESKGTARKNLWTAPVVNVFDVPGKSDSLSKLTSLHHRTMHSLLSPILGSGKSNIRTYLIPPGMTFARFHSHTSREEFYLVLEGKGNVRIGGHKLEVKKGDLISKPTGPDLATQFLADLGKDLRILDVEVWPDIDKRSKDLVHYPDHGELDLFGEGWNMMIPDEAIHGVEDSMKNYEVGYFRHIDGSWEPREMPGFTIRKKETGTRKNKK
jgi:uncharacterized cupin superfamily protein